MRSYLRLILTNAFIQVTLQGMLFGQMHSQDSTLNESQKSIIAISALTANGDLDNLKGVLNNGLDAGLSINKIRECLIHAYAYCGFPRSIRGLQTLMGVLDERKSKGIKDEIGLDASPIDNTSSKYDRGKKILSELTNMPDNTPLKGYSVFAPAIDTFLKEHLFSDIFERNVLTYSERELVTISVLTAIGKTEPMLSSHYSICINMGYTPGQLYSFTANIRPYIEPSEYEVAQNVLNKLLETNKNVTMSSRQGTQEIFAKGEKIVGNNHFTGIVWVNMLLSSDSLFTTNVGNVTFEPGARTNWHSHPGGQILLITSGNGRYQEEGKPVFEIRQGDIIKCEPNVKHWHGAAPDSELTHIAISINQQMGAVKWMEPVSDREYNLR